jgi:hypothetical protein
MSESGIPPKRAAAAYRWLASILPTTSRSGHDCMRHLEEFGDGLGGSISRCSVCWDASGRDDMLSKTDVCDVDFTPFLDELENAASRFRVPDAHGYPELRRSTFENILKRFRDAVLR